MTPKKPFCADAAIVRPLAWLLLAQIGALLLAPCLLLLITTTQQLPPDAAAPSTPIPHPY